MLTADDVQKWLEEKRTLPGSAQPGAAPEPGRDRARAAAASVTPIGASPGGRGGNVLVLRDPVRAPGAQGVLAAMGSTEFALDERPRRSWPLTLGVGLLSGVVLGVGLVGLAGSAPPWLAGLLGADSPVASAGSQEPIPAAATQPRPAEPSEPAIPEPAALDPAPPEAAPAQPAAAQPAPAQPAPASPAATDAAPPAPRLVDPPRSDPRPVLVQADRRPLRRRPAVLEPPGLDDGSAVLTATAPLDAAPWRPSPLPEPAVDPGASASLVASASPEVARIGPVQALAAPSSPDQPPAPNVAETAVAAAPLPAAAPLRVALHLAPSLPQTAIYDAQAAVTEAGFDLAGTSLARFGVARSEVRFFHGVDAAGAARIADSLGAQARDFSAYRPAPPPGTVEVWLAPEG